MASHMILGLASFVLGFIAAGTWFCLRIRRKRSKLSALARQLDDALQLNRIKTLFFANMSHEIRTPLGSIHGFAKLLESDDLSESERKKFASIIQNAASGLTDIVNDVLDLSKIESGRLQIDKKNINLKEHLQEIKGLLEIKAQEKDISLVFLLDDELPERIFCDPLRLRQILLNLLCNAIKFTHEGQVSLEVMLKEDRILFDIRDTGVGVPFHLSKVIFEPFEQGDRNLAEENGGTGLGLPLAKQLAELLGGELLLLSSLPGKGSCFRFQMEYERPIEIPMPLAGR